MDRVVKAVVTALLIFLFSPKTIFAVTIKINSFPSSITNEAFEVNLSIEGAKPATNYLRIELFKDGTSNYFGETFNGKDWYGGSDGLLYFPIEINSSTTSAIVKGRVGENYQSENGEYKLKIKRYTASGNSANDKVDPVSVILAFKLETISPTPQETPRSPSPTIVQIKSSSEAVVQGVSTITKTPTPTIQVTKSTTTPIATQEEKEITPSPLVMADKKEEFAFVPAIIFATGLFFIGIGIYLLYNKYNAQKND